MKTFLYVLAALGSIIGGFFLFLALTVADSAPQEGSLAAIGVAFAVIPYVFARAVAGADEVTMPAHLRYIAEHFQRIDSQAANARIQETRQATSSNNPLTAPRSQRSANVTPAKWPEG